MANIRIEVSLVENMLLLGLGRTKMGKEDNGGEPNEC